MKITIPSEIDERKLGDDICLSKTSDATKLFVLNETGAFIWSSIKKSFNYHEVVENIIKNYEMDSATDIYYIVEYFLQQLQDKEIIVLE